MPPRDTHAPAKGRPGLWGAGQIAVQVYRDLPSLLLLFYMTQHLDIPPALAGVAIFVPKLCWSTVMDYVVGIWSDRLRARLPRRFLLLGGALLLPVALIALFTPPSTDAIGWRAAYVSAWLIVYVSVFSLFSVPHLSIGAELATDARDRSRVMAWRTAYVGAGALFGNGLAPWLIAGRGGGESGYRLMAITMAAVCSLSLLIAFSGSRESRAPAGGAPPMRWRMLARDHAMRAVLMAMFAQMAGQGAAYATFTYLVMFKLGFANPFAILSISVLFTAGATVLAQPLWARVTAAAGARRSFVVSSLFYALALGLMAWGPVRSAPFFYAAATLLGLSNSLSLQSLATRLSEVIGAAGERSASAVAGFYASLYVAAEKIGFAFGGTLVAGSLLQLTGFVAGRDRQSAVAIVGIAAVFSGVPLIGNLLAAGVMARRLPGDRGTR